MSAMPGIIELLRAVVAQRDAEELANDLGEVRMVLDATMPSAGRIHVTPADEGLSSIVVHFKHPHRNVESVTVMAKPETTLITLTELGERFGKYTLGGKTGSRGPRELAFLIEVDVRSDRIGILSALVFNDREPVEKWRVAGLTIAHGSRI